MCISDPFSWLGYSCLQHHDILSWLTPLSSDSLHRSKTNENISSLKYYCMSWHIRWPFSLKIAFKDGVDLYTKGNEKSPILGLRAKTSGLADFPPVIGGNNRHSYCLLRESQVVCVCVQSPWKELCGNWAKELAWLLCKDSK